MEKIDNSPCLKGKIKHVLSQDVFHFMLIYKKMKRNMCFVVSDMFRSHGQYNWYRIEVFVNLTSKLIVCMVELVI